MNNDSNHITQVQTPIQEDRKIWLLLEQVTDPEIPVLSIVDLGIVRDVKLSAPSILPLGGRAIITITPTYSGCPAMDMIAENIKITLHQNGFDNIQIITSLSPAWTTDWMTEKGKEKLKAYGIAPPVSKSFDREYLENINVECPQCHSKNTHLLSQFGSTSCKALFICDDCREPFDYFKCH